MVPRMIDPPVRPVTLGGGLGHESPGFTGAVEVGGGGVLQGQTLSLGRVPGEEGRACWGEQGARWTGLPRLGGQGPH